jgi:hypothetical protein
MALVIYMLVSDRYTDRHHIQEKFHNLGCPFIPCWDIKRQATQKDSTYRIRDVYELESEVETIRAKLATPARRMS